MIKITFLGQGEFSKPIRAALIKNNNQLVDLDENPDLIVVASWGEILSKKILDAPRYGSLNVHPSLLPKYRGATPIQSAILNGEKKTGVTIIKMDEEVDHGPIIAISNFQFPISNFTYLELSKKLSELGAKLLIKTIPDYISGKIKPRLQDHKQATFTKMLKREDGLINWSKSAEEIERQICAYCPWPGSYLILPDGKRLIIHKAHLENKFLVFDKVQKESKGAVNWKEFKRGYRQGLTFPSEKVRY